MSEQTPYQQLRVSENATFEEIQESRNVLIQEYHGDRQKIEAIEAAYDAILMQRLKLRQEGKIKVPDRIRFAEKVAETPPAIPAVSKKEAPAWLQNLLDTPEQSDILWPAGIFLGLSLLGLFQSTAVSLALALGVAFSIYFLNRKEQKFLRAVGLTLVALILGLSLGSLLGSWLATGGGIALRPESLAAFITCFFLWLASSFLK
jgi:Protein CHAPERONE-LIKE PROTEIN OF POR1-like